MNLFSKSTWLHASNSLRLYRGGVFSLGILLGIVLLGCNEEPSQNPKDSFVEGKFPRALESIRSQVPELSQSVRERIVKRAAEDARRTDLIHVLVIDSGVDLAHPDLVDQLVYRVRDGRIVGSGFDIRGEGEFGSHIMVDPALFAFGAERIIDGRIGPGYDPRPIHLLSNINKAFQDFVLKGLAEDPQLQASLFRNLPRESIVISLFEGLWQMRNELKRAYRDKSESDRFNLSNIEAKRTRANERLIQRDLVKGWDIAGSGFEVPALTHIEFIEGADAFLDLIDSAFAEIDVRYGYNKRVNQLREFLGAKTESGKPVDRDEAISVLEGAFRFHYWGHEGLDPVEELEVLVRSNPRFDGADVSQALNILADHLEKKASEVLQNGTGESTALKEVKKGRRQIGRLRVLATELDRLKMDPDRYRKMRSDLRRFRYRTQHPYLDPRSATNSHGTHVAALIAKKDPRIRIIPISVVTSTPAIHRDREEELREAFLTGFTEWLAQDSIQHLKRLVVSEYKGSAPTDRTLKRELGQYLKQNTLNLVFIDQVLKAVKLAGELAAQDPSSLEVPYLANVSLGTSFEKKVKESDRIKSITEDLFAEYARYLIGKAMEPNSERVLYAVATGNDGTWIDGRSRTSFPVGLTSLRMHQLAKAGLVEVPPNNRIRNVVAVGSTGPKGALSAFTNLMIDPLMNTVFSDGEDELAAVPRKNSGQYKRFVARRIGPIQSLASYIKVLETEQKALANGSESDPGRAVSHIDPEQKLYDEVVESGMVDLIGASSNLLQTYFQAIQPIEREQMTGTSMATPNAVGILAGRLAELKEQSPSRAWTARSAVDLLMHEAKDVEEVGVVKVEVLLHGLDPWPKSKNMRKANGLVDKFLPTRLPKHLGSQHRSSSLCSAAFK